MMMKVKDVMEKDFVTIDPETTIKEAARILAVNDLSALPVVSGNKLVGIVAEDDFLGLIKEKYVPMGVTILPTPFDYLIELPIRTRLELYEIKKSFEDVANKKVKEIMVKKVITTTPEEDISDVAFVMHENRIDQLPVMENGKIIGFVSRSDIIKGLAGLKKSKDEWQEENKQKE